MSKAEFLLHANSRHCVSARRQQQILYEPRDSASNAFSTFLESSERCLAVVGASGAGKWSFVNVLVDQLKDDRPLFYYDARLLTESLFTSIVADFGRVGGPRCNSGTGNFTTRQHGSRIWDRLPDCNRRNRRSLERSRLALELDQLIRRTEDRNIRLVCAVRDSEWFWFLYPQNAPSALASVTCGSQPDEVVASIPTSAILDSSGTVPGIHLGPLDDYELEGAWERYRQIYRINGEIAGELRERARLPFSMAMIAQAYEGSTDLPTVWIDASFT